MHPERDFDAHAALPPHECDLSRDLELDTLLHAMAGEDQFLFGVARTALLTGFASDTDTVRYRQEVLADCLANAALVRELYRLSVETAERKRRLYLGVYMKYPSGILYGGIEALELFTGMLRRLRQFADQHHGSFRSRGWSALLSSLRRELGDDFLAEMAAHLDALRFASGVLVSAELGTGNAGANYVLRQSRAAPRGWLDRLFRRRPSAFTVRIHERDEAGARALGALRDRAINLVANSAAQATEHLMSFFDLLRTELAFYVCCLNLHDVLIRSGVPICFPEPLPPGGRTLRCAGLTDVCLALTARRPVVGNAVHADGRNLVVVTGANQGGKSTFLRSIGLAQLMMQCGMFVAATSFAAELCVGLFTHFKREEDAAMTMGKLDEELSRMSTLADVLRPNWLVLFNESFAATNEREGSEVARQIVEALLDRRIKVLFVTHLYTFARGLFASRSDGLFLRAERLPDGTRTFRVVPGEPLETSYGEDVYRAVFGARAASG
jgi:hypothetical protein